MRAFAQTLLRCAALALAAAPVAACRAEAPVAADKVSPALELTGRVVDAANVLAPDIETDLTDRLEALEADTGVQFVVVSTPSLDGYDIKDYSVRLANAWGIGNKDRNDGLMLLVAPSDREVRISTGTGLEKKLTDPECQVVVDRMLVNFRTGDLTGGIVLGTELLDQAVRSKFGKST